MRAMTVTREMTDKHREELQAESVKTKISTMTLEDINHQLLAKEQKIKLHCEDDRSAPLLACFEVLCNPEDLDDHKMPTNVNISQVGEKHRRIRRQLLELLNHCKRSEFLKEVSTDIKGEEFTVGSRINRLIKSYDDAFEQIVLYNRQSLRMNERRCETQDDLLHCTTMDSDEEDLSPFQGLLIFLLNSLDRMELKRYKGQCCEQIGKTRAWRPVMPIGDFVYTMTQKETKYDMWKNITSKGCIVKDTVRHLTECVDIQFPDIKKDRTVWSFKNGILLGKVWTENRYTWRFFEYDSPDFAKLDPTVTACKYFDQELCVDDTPDWYDIQTPHFQSVLDYQKFPPDVARWMYVMAGRLMYDVGDIDQWQVITFFKGIARSGKSTLITKVFKKFYEAEDVKTLSNNIERKFGLSMIHDAFLFISPEVKGDLCLEQAEFQSMVSGEDISIARKNEKALSITWKTPGVLAGNEVPNWRDNSGSVLRRLVTFNFAKQVIDADPKLDEKLDQELPQIMLKCTRAYLDYANKYADKDIWQVLPEYFRQIQNQVAMVTNSLQHFLASEKLVYGTDRCCPQKLFVQMFNQHCLENNLGRFKFNPDFYMGPFSSRDLDVRTETRMYAGRQFPSQAFVFGVDITQDMPSEFSTDL
jgi:hypothetical protein